MHDLLQFLLDNGIGQNITAGALTVLLGWLWSKTKYWPLNLVHQRLNELHDKHDRLMVMHVELHDKHQQLLDKHEELRQALAGGSGPDASNVGG